MTKSRKKKFEETKPTLLLFDGNHLSRRSWFTIGRSLKTRTGIGSGAYFGTLKSMRKVIMKLQPNKVMFFFDGGHERQTKLLPTYKENQGRDRDPEFYKQLNAFEDTVRALGIVSLRVEGVEADELIGVASRELRGSYDVVIVSSDHDFYQLICDGVSVYDDLHDKHITIDNFQEFYPGLMPVDTLMVKAIAGDKSDNVPGVPGIGEGTAEAVVHMLGGAAGVMHWLRDKIDIDPEVFDKRIRWRIERGFADVNAVRKIVARNLRVVKIPTSQVPWSEKVQRQYTGQLEQGVPYSVKGVKAIMELYQLESLLLNLDHFTKPILNVNGPIV